MKKLIMFLLFFQCTYTIDRCQSNKSYQSCINSTISKCFWNENSSKCIYLSNYMLGCNPYLNKPACIGQIGDTLNQIAKCRFIVSCENILDSMIENCSNNLNKFSCLSVSNPNQICYWENDFCHTLQQEEWNSIQQNFENHLYSISACSHIQHYLIIHNLLLWQIIGYTPNLIQDAETIYLADLGIETNIVIEHSYNNQGNLQNNYQLKNGKYFWYTYRQSESIVPSNLKISDRYREGCIALEIQNDNDYEMIFTLSGDIRGVNHIYCQYLNKQITNEPYYIFSQEKCYQFRQVDLANQQQIQDLECESFNKLYCIYFYSLKSKCKIQDESYEYQCLTFMNQQSDDCQEFCTISKCKEKDNYYIEYQNNLCVNDCLNISSQQDCETQQNCVFLGRQFEDKVIVCSPPQICDQIGLSYKVCKYLRAKCHWDNSLEQCFSLNDEQIQYFKCSDVINIYVCTLITLSDQLCFWNSETEICLNILDQPILLTYSYLINDQQQVLRGYNQTTISNLNLCIYSDKYYVYYQNHERRCYYYPDSNFNNDLPLNRFDCLNSDLGLSFWKQKYLLCDRFLIENIRKTQCLDLLDINEKVCQYALVSNSNNFCKFNKNENKCQELQLSEINDISCEGNGLSQQICIQKYMCQYQGQKCSKLSEDYVNSLSCQTFYNVNGDVCSFHNKDSELCDYNEILHSCYSPSILALIKYSKFLNRFSCQKVIDQPTFYDIVENKCIIINMELLEILQIKNCNDFFFSKMACKIFKINGTNCFWSESHSVCQTSNQNFISCNEVENDVTNLCTTVENNVNQKLFKANFCSYYDNKCQQNIQPISDCGENEIMNIHRCSGLSGLDENLQPIQMCAFYNQQCKTLNQNDLNTEILLDQINCKEANFSACVNVTTLGQFCVAINNMITKNILFLDRKCISMNYSQYNCQSLNQLYSQDIINKTFCSQATDSCFYQQDIGCTVPNQIDMDCNTPGLSEKGCLNNTENKSCAYLNNQCQYLSEQSIITECSNLNKFLCDQYKYTQCIWNQDICENDLESLNITKFSCSRTNDNTLQIYQNNQCIQIEASNLNEYTCESEGLNYFICQSLTNHYCIFQENQCQFYRQILCEDTIDDCSLNNSGNQLCVFKDGLCFNAQNIYQNVQCDFFEKTNYEFCFKYSKCAFSQGECKQQFDKNQIFCEQSLLGCVFHNLASPCQYHLESNYCEVLWEIDECPHFDGFYSQKVCHYIHNCYYGYTKTGLGFCYRGNIEDFTCEQIPQFFCTQDLTHLNAKLICYYDDQCRTLNKENQNCKFLSQFPSNYSACRLVQENEECLYSHVDHLCKPRKEYFKNICQGNSVIECSLIQNICYFDGDNCIENGTINQLNKYGCIQQEGFWKFQNFTCVNLENGKVLQSCNLISKNACLSQMTQELYCRWQNNQCQQVLIEEGKQINNCTDLNKRVCLSVRLSNIQCIWNTEQNQCQEIIIKTDQCNYDSNGQNLSQSVCGNYAGKSCARDKNGNKCGELTVILNSCNEYILNEYACITMTTGNCQWKTFGDGGYCDQANLYTTLCNQNNNKNTCQNIQTIGQICFWNKIENKCENKEILTCESASFLNGNIACISTKQQLCFYNQITNQCKQLLPYKLRQCQNYYNNNACLTETQECLWDKNICIQNSLDDCNASQNKYQCLKNAYQSCQWIDNYCQDFNITDQTYCSNLPSNISDGACQMGSFQPCSLDQITESCYPDYKLLGNQILKYQNDQFTSPILSGNCDELLNKKDCVKSRKIDQACIWIDSCQKLNEFNKINCLDNLNIYGCLKIIKQNQHCFWQGQCFDWDPSLNIITNVNINVCKHYTVNKIYQNNSCVPYNIDQIQCDFLGVSKETCLSITKQQCTWNEQSDSCIYFENKNQKKCNDYIQVSPFVCQMQVTDQCIQNKITKNCEIAPQNSLIIGISIQVCLQNSQQAVNWNGYICQIDTDNLECDYEQKVNYLSCVNRINQPCIYDSKTQTCTSKFNMQSIRCSTLGLNLLGCVQVQTEPCQFLNGQCQLFSDYTTECNSVLNVNAKACASIINEKCQYNSIYKFCYQSLIQKDACNIDGINKLICQSNNICNWNQDYLNCQCKGNQLTQTCQYDNYNECIQNNLCFYENSFCQLKQCYHLQQEECQYQLLAGSVCYLNNLNECQPAKQCEDIINPIVYCSSIFINSVSCVQNENSCVSYNNYKIVCPLSDCLNSKCINEFGYCRQRKCSDYESKDCNKQDGCYLNIQQVCDELIQCLIIDNNTFGFKASLICNQVSVDNLKCNWQQISQFNSQEICTNQYCGFFGSSISLCHGNEINGISCVLTKNYLCISCEEIIEECNCNNQTNICQFTNNKCQSISCNSFKTSKQCELAKDRCYWSDIVQDGSCQLICEKIYNQELCLERSEECYYEPLVGYCKTGKQYQVNLNINISIQTLDINILFLSILIIFVN